MEERYNDGCRCRSVKVEGKVVMGWCVWGGGRVQAEWWGEGCNDCCCRRLLLWLTGEGGGGGE